MEHDIQLAVDIEQPGLDSNEQPEHFGSPTPLTNQLTKESVHYSGDSSKCCNRWTSKHVTKPLALK